jgi:MFS family permease
LGLKEVATQRNIATLSISTFFLIIVEYFVSPWWPLFFLDLGANEIIIGAVATIQTASGMLSQLPGGLLADRFGRKKVLVFATSIRIIGGFFLIFARTWQQFVPALVIQNISIGLAMNALYAIVGESVPPEKRGIAFAIPGMAGMLPGLFMPIITGLQIDRFGLFSVLRIGFVIYLVVSVGGTIFRIIFIEETLKTEEEVKPISGIKDVVKFFNLKRDVVIMLIVACISGFSFRLASPFLAIYAVEIIGFTKTQWGTLQSAMRVFHAILTLPGGILADRFSRRLPILISRIISPFNQLSLVLMSNFSHMLIVYVLIGISSGLGGGIMGGPAWNALLADLVPKRDRGKFRGLMNSISSLVSMPASIIGGYLWTTISPEALLYSAFFFGITSAFTFIFVKEPKVKEQ